MENKLIFKDKELKNTIPGTLGVVGENEQEILVFEFEDGFVDGVGYLEIELPNLEKGLIELEKDTSNECYKLEVKSSLLKHEGFVKMQLRIVKNTSVWKSLDFEMYVSKTVNTDSSIAEDYVDFFTETKQKLEDLENKKQNKLIPRR